MNEENNRINEPEEVDEELEFLKAQIRHKKMLQEKKAKEEEENEDYSYIKRFKINSYIEYAMGIIGIIGGLLLNNNLLSSFGIIMLCFGYLFSKVAKHGKYKQDKNKK